VLRRTSDRLLCWSLAVILALFQFRLIAFMIEANYARCIDAAVGVAEGKPHWRVYQNRVLGPYVLEGLAKVFPSMISAHVFFTIVLLSVAGWQAWRLGTRVAGRRGALLALVALHVCFAFLLGRRWLYLWDLIDLCVFLALVDFILADRPWPWFVGLWAVGILNHEIVMFVGAWLVADPIARWGLAKRKRLPPAPFERTKVLAGVACVGASYLLVEALRSALLVEEVGPALFTTTTAAGAVHVTLWENLEILRFMFTRWDYGMPIVIPILLAGVVAILVALARRDLHRFAGYAVTNLAIIASLLTFGVLTETRIYVVLIPVIVAGLLVLVEHEPAPGV
jgi:hypothetical protein